MTSIVTSVDKCHFYHVNELKECQQHSAVLSTLQTLIILWTSPNTKPWSCWFLIWIIPTSHLLHRKKANHKLASSHTVFYSQFSTDFSVRINFNILGSFSCPAALLCSPLQEVLFPFKWHLLASASRPIHMASGWRTAGTGQPAVHWAVQAPTAERRDQEAPPFH